MPWKIADLSGGGARVSSARALRWTWAAFLLLIIVPTSMAAAADDYLLGPGDMLTVAILDTGLSFEATVLADGSISIPYAGRILCGGRTTTEVERDISDKLSAEMKTSRVIIQVAEPRKRFVYAMGSGLKEWAGQVPLRPAMRISQLLAAVGGTSARPGMLICWLRRGSGEALPVDIVSLLLTARPEVDLLLGEGDVLLVERVDRAGVYVTGAVVLPAAYSFAPGAGAARAVLEAGGVTPGADVKHVAIWRANRTREEADLTEALLHNDFSKDVPLNPGDVVIVPGPPAPAGTVAVVGAVVRPGYYALRDAGSSTVADLLALAGGPISSGAAISVLRSIEGRPTPLPAIEGESIDRTVVAGDIILVTNVHEGPAR